MEDNKNEKILKIALGIVVVLFLGTGFYTLNLYQTSIDDKKELTDQKMEVMNDLNIMAKQYTDAIDENEVVNSRLGEARGRIQGLIDSLKISETNVKSLWRYKRKYSSLHKEMDFLLAQNDSLRVENSYLSTSLDSTRVRLEERNMFSDSLLVQNTALAEIVENASILNTVALKGFGVIERTSGKLIPTERASRTDKIRICFTVVKNTLVQAGDKELYIEVIDPNNNTLGLNKQINFEGRALKYSIICKYNYENSSIDICEFVTKGEDKFAKGRYVVKVFNHRELVSNTEFTLR